MLTNEIYFAQEKAYTLYDWIFLAPVTGVYNIFATTYPTSHQEWMDIDYIVNGIWKGGNTTYVLGFNIIVESEINAQLFEGQRVYIRVICPDRRSVCTNSSSPKFSGWLEISNER